MTGNIALDVAIGLVFVYCLYSLLTTTLAEFIALIFQLRAKNLQRAIRRMLDDGKTSVFAERFYQIPLVKYLASGRFSKIFGVNTKPSNLPPDMFSQGLIYLLKDGAPEGKEAKDAIKDSLLEIKHTDTGKYLLFLFNEAKEDIEKFTKSLERWFDATMERCTGWYKKNLTFITLILGLILTTIFNIDSFQIAGKLSKDTNAREQYVQLAGQMIQNPMFSKSAQTFDTSVFKSNLNDSGFYWQMSKQKELISRMDTLYKLSEESREILSFERNAFPWWFYNSWKNFLGCLVTAIALALGAPFWFDLLNKVMQLKSSVSAGKSVPKTEKTNAGEKN